MSKTYTKSEIMDTDQLALMTAKLRRLKNLSQQQVAKQIGVSAGSIAHAEKVGYGPGMNKMRIRIIKHLTGGIEIKGPVYLIEGGELAAIIAASGVSDS